MLCEICKKNQANVHYKYAENGSITEMYLCSSCAKEKGLVKPDGMPTVGFLTQNGIYDDYFGKSPFSTLFPGSGNTKNNSIRQRICPGCGMSESELRSGGKLGCEQCYSVFGDTVEKLLRKMHFSTEYKGKAPEGHCEKISVRAKIEKLKSDMQTAVENQEYEEAAKLRDAIRQLENDDGNNDK